MAKRGAKIRKPSAVSKPPTRGKRVPARKRSALRIDPKKENADLRRELARAIERQMATSDVLDAINKSPFEIQPVLDTIVRTASRLCEAEFALIYRLLNGQYHLAATNNTATAFIKYAAKHPLSPGRGSLIGRTALEEKPVHLPDCLADPEYVSLDYQRAGKYRTMLGVPLRRKDALVGVIALMRAVVKPFTDDQIDLVTTFANQAVIAIENVRLFDEIQASARDLTETLERQTATSEVLQVISRSTFDLQSVLDTLTESAARLCSADMASITRRGEDEHFYHVTNHNFPSDWVEYTRTIPLKPGRGTVVGRVLLERKAVQIPDVLADPEYTHSEQQRKAGYRTFLAVPLLRQGQPVGVFSLCRRIVAPFTDKQVELVSTFADQAVIAIENVRLFDEVQTRTEDLRKSLEYQTAISSVLGVISRSPSDIQPVLDTIAETAQHLCQSEHAYIMRLRDGKYHLAAARGAQPDRLRYLRENPITPGRGSMVGRVALELRPVHVSDVSVDREYTLSMAGDPGYRTMLGVPLLRHGAVIGVIVLTRGTVLPFSERQIELVSTFADQALIAIENVRLFDEVKAKTDDLAESLQQQTATAEVLKVISRSTFDLQIVFDTLVESATRLCDADHAWIFQRDGDFLHWAASYGHRTDIHSRIKRFFLGRDVPIDRSSVVGRSALEGRIVHLPDVLADPEYTWGEAQKIGGYRAALGAPLMRDGKIVGVIFVARTRPEPYSAKQIELVTTFADQAVIAIENVRLFEEVQARTDDLTESLEYQTAISDVLGVISRSPSQVQPVLDAIVATAVRLCGADSGTITRERDGQFYRSGQSGFSAEFGELMARAPVEISRGTITGRTLLEGKVVQIPDAEADPEFTWREALHLREFRTLLGVPLLREGVTIGVIALAHRTVRPFTDRQIKLVTTFAEQAVIAINNVRLFDEVQARTEDLRESLQQQTATAEVLKVISRSTFDLQVVLQTLVESAARLCDAEKGTITRQKDGVFFRAENYGFSEEFTNYARNVPVVPDRGSAIGRALLEGVVIHIPDVRADHDYTFAEGQRLGDFRSILGVPMMREGIPIGVIVLTRSEVRPFNEKQIELATTFADQAAIAIENVRLFDEVQARTRDLSESLRQQTATADVLKVISRSAFDLQAVLDALLASACRLCEADIGTIRYLDSGNYRLATTFGCKPEWIAHFSGYSTRPDRSSVFGRTIVEGHTVHIPDVLADPDFRRPEAQKLMGFRAALGVPLVREGQTFGVINLFRLEAGSFNDKQIELVSTFADQAVIAIENVRLFDEVQAKTRDLTEALTYQTGSANILKVIAASPTEVGPVLKAIVDNACEVCEAYDAAVLLKDGEDLRFSAHHGPIPIGLEKWPINRRWTAGRAFLDKAPVHLHDLLAGENAEFSDGRELSLRMGHRSILSVPLLRENEAIGAIVLRRTEVHPFSDKQIGLLQTFADQAVIAIGNVRLFEQVQQRTRQLAASLDDLRTAQDRLVQTEKLASLGQLTAGIAHEIKNPLNFVNNFAALSGELIDELNDALKPAELDGKTREEIDELSRMLKGNLEKVVQHGKRADSIVKNMLLHSREGSGEHRPGDINAIVEESLNLAYHGARAENSGFNISLEREFDPAAGMIDVYPQEITRVFLNLISNGFYAAIKRKEAGDAGFEPALSAATRSLGNEVEIRIRDNGTGIPPEVKEKMFNPFFTTKPAGEGTGLGLSMSHDIIVKQHGGTIDVATEPGAFTEFIITLPRTGRHNQ